MSTGGRYRPGEPGLTPGGSGAATRQPRLTPSKRPRRIVHERTFAMSDVVSSIKPLGLRPAPLSPSVLAQRSSSSRGQCRKKPGILLLTPSVIVQRPALRGAPRRRQHAGRGAGGWVCRTAALAFRATIPRYRHTILGISSSSSGARWRMARGGMGRLARERTFSLSGL